jgi:ABC-type branched-subunit amino acid transport system ATPase component
MSVEDSVVLALERKWPTPLFSSVVGSQKLERSKRKRARELISLMGLEPHSQKAISALSTGTSRIVELACMIALEPRLLLLDEPSSGIAQKESEALGGVLEGVKQHLRTTLVIIEHDIPLLMGLAQRAMAMESGQVIATGSPAEIRANPLVIESYLGSNRDKPERPSNALTPSGLDVRR